MLTQPHLPSACTPRPPPQAFTAISVGADITPFRSQATAHAERDPEVCHWAHAGSKGFEKGGRSPRVEGESRHLSVMPHSSARG